MADDWYSNYYKNRNKTTSYKETESKPKEPHLLSKEKQVRLTKEFIQEVNKIQPPSPSPVSSRYLDYRKKESISFEKPDKSIPIVEPKPMPKEQLKSYYTRPYYPSLSPKPIVKQEPIKEEPQKIRPKANEILSELGKKFTPEINKTYIVLITFIIILVIIGGIYFFTQKAPDTKILPIDITASNKTTDSSVYYNNKYILTLSGWETKLEYKNQTDRLFGNEEYKKVIFDNQGKAYTAIMLDNEIRLEPLSSNPDKVTRIGWFANAEEISVSEIKSFSDKTINVNLVSDKDLIKNATIIYNFYNGKPYFKIQFTAGAENNTNLGDFSYGLILQNYDIYLPSGENFTNDNKIIYLNKTIELNLVSIKNSTTNISKDLLDSLSKKLDLNRKAYTRAGSFYEDNSDYQMFVDKNQTRAIIVYSPYILLFQDSFYWNVFWVNVLKLENGNFSPLYIIVVNNPKLEYDETEQDWTLDSAQFKGTVNDYINEVVNKIWDEK